MAVKNNLNKNNINFENKYLPVIIWNKKHLSKQFVSTTCSVEKGFFAVATFDGL